MLTVDELKQALPPNLRNNATQEFADLVNQIAEDPDVAREVRNNFLTYKHVLVEGRYKTEDYLSAIAYCTFKLMGLSNKDSYINTFPKRYEKLVADGRSSKEIAAYISAYSNGKMVNTILEQAYIPVWLINRDVYQKAINTQMLLMQDENISPMARTAAANSLLLHLKQPEVKKIELDMNIKGDSGLADLKETMTRLAETQAQLIANGAGAKVVSRIPLKVSPEEQIIDVVPVSVPKVPAQPQVAPAPRPVAKPNLFEPKPAEPPKTPEDVKGPVANYARCCDAAIEDCSCEDPEHILLPTNADVPARRRVSLFDDPADMP